MRRRTALIVTLVITGMVLGYVFLLWWLAEHPVS